MFDLGTPELEVVANYLRAFREVYELEANVLVKQLVADVRAELVAGLLPGVKLVPAHTMLIGLAQERGCTYEKV